MVPFDLGGGLVLLDKREMFGLMTHTKSHNVSRNIRIACIARLRRKTSKKFDTISLKICGNTGRGSTDQFSVVRYHRSI